MIAYVGIVLAILMPFFVFLIYVATPLASPVGGHAWTKADDFNSLMAISGTNIQMPNERDTRVLVLNNLHVTFTSNDRTFNNISTLVDKTNPDLIIVLGNSVGFWLNDVSTTRLINKMDSFEIPWAITINQFDTRGKATRNRLAYMFEDSAFGLFQFGPRDLYNVSGNYFINLLRGSQIVHTLFMMGSGRGDTTFQNEWFYWAINGNRALSADLKYTVFKGDTHPTFIPTGIGWTSRSYTKNEPRGGTLLSIDPLNGSTITEKFVL